MNGNKKLISFLILFISSLVLNTKAEKVKYNLVIQEINEEKNIIELTVGKYTLIHIMLNGTDSEKFSSSKTNIKLVAPQEAEFIKTEEDLYLIQPFLSMTYSIYIGVPCGSIDKVGEYKLSLVQSGSPEDGIEILSKEFTVKVVSKKNFIVLSPMPSLISPNSYGIIQMINDPLNFDDISITFEHEKNFNSNLNSGSASCPSIVLKSYKSRTKDAFRSSNSLGNSIIGNYSYNGTYNYIKEKFKIKSENSCFSPSLNAISFTIIEDKLPTLDNDFRDSLVNSFTLHEPESEDSISFSVHVPEGPVLMNCVLIPQEDQFESDEDIIQKKKEQSNLYRLNSFYINGEVDEFKVTFSQLVKGKKYKSKCVIKNFQVNDNAFSNSRLISFTVDKSKYSDINLELIPKNSNKFPSQCANWKLNITSSSSIETIGNKLMENCNKIAFLKTGEVGINNKGCISCKLFVKENELSICITSSSFCQTSFVKDKEDPPSIFREFTSNYQTPEDFKKIGEEGVNEVKSFYIEVESESPPIEEIMAEVIGKPDTKKACFNITTKVNQTIECRYNENLDRSISERWSYESDLKGKFLATPNEPYVLEFDFSSRNYDNLTYSLIISCNYLPEKQSNYFSTGAFKLGVFLNTDKTKNYTTVPKKDCSKDKGYKECIKRKVFTIKRSFIYKKPTIIKEIEEEISDFLLLNFGMKYIKLEFEKDKLLTLLQNNSTLEIYKQFLKLAKGLQQKRCELYPNFEECLNEKREIQKVIIENLEKFINCKNYEDLVESKNLTESKDNNLLLISSLITEITSNSDSFNKNSELLFNLTKCLADSFENFWKNKNTTIGETKDEREKIHLQVDYFIIESASNFFRTLKYEQFESMGEKIQFSKNGIISGNENIKTAKERRDYFEKVARSLWKYEDTIHKIGNYQIRIDRQDSSSYGSNIFEDKSKGIKLNMKVNSLLFNHYASVSQIIFYEDYPFESFDNDKFNNHVVSIKFYDKNGKEMQMKKLSNIPEIEYTKTDSKSQFTNCYYFDEKKKEFYSDGVTSKNKEENVLECSLTHFTDFTIGTGNIGKWRINWIIIIIIACSSLLLIVLVVVFVVLKKRKSKKRNSIIEGIDDSKVGQLLEEPLNPI